MASFKKFAQHRVPLNMCQLLFGSMDVGCGINYSFFFTEWKLIIVHGILNTYGNSAGWTSPPARISETQIPR